MEGLLNELIEQCRPDTKNGKVASYIPALAKADPNALGVYILDRNGLHSQGGDSQVRFSIQSIIKPMLLLLALMDNGEEYVRRRVGVESTGKPFDAINISDAVSQEILSEHINPMVNMGAIVMTTLIKGDSYKERFDRLLDLTRKLANNPDIDVDEEVYLSEKATGNKNRALAFLMRSCGLLDDDVEEVLDCYFRACSIRVDCRDLARIAFVLSNKGRDFMGNELFPARYAHYVNAVMLTCGMYDGAGDFAVTVGVPAKSGVGGGIMAVVPGRMGIGIYSPALNKKGNSIAGLRILRRLSRQLELSIF
jgi:glutaminase